MRLGIFGGTFDPIHMGHVTASLKFYDEARLDKLLVIPDRIPPHKEGKPASGEDRLEMVRIAYSDRALVKDRCVEPSNIELLREGKSYTFVTLCELSQLYPEAELFMYTGSDLFYTLERWYRGEDILKMCSVVTCARQEDERNRLLKTAADYSERYGTRSIVMDIEPVVLSSTEIRALASRECGKKFLEFTKNLLTEGVAEYIMRNKLYCEK